MTRPPRISLDAMGGDNAPDITLVQGADKALAAHPGISLVFVGDERRVRPLLERSDYLRSADILHTEEEVAAEAKPSLALRAGKQTSMWKAIELVANGEADAIVSAGKYRGL